MIGDVLVSETCTYTANRIAARAGDEPYVTITTQTAHDHVRIGYDGNRQGVPRGACGAIHIALTSGSKNAGAVQAGQAHRQGLAAVIDDIRRLAAELGSHYVPGTTDYGTPLPEATPRLQAAGIEAKYHTTVLAALDGAAQASQASLEADIERTTDDQGWLGAATFFNLVAKHQILYQDAALDLPDVHSPGRYLSRWSPPASSAVRGVRAWLASQASQASHNTALSAATSPSDGLITYILGGIFGARGTTIISTTDPLGDLVALGHWFINSTLSAITILTGLAAGNNALEAVPFVGKALDVFEATWSVVGPFMTTILMIVATVGVVLAYLLPTIPFIRFLFGIFVWLIGLCEAIIAMPLFFMAHLSSAEQGLVPQAARYGYVLVLNATLRPALMVIGLVLGYLLFIAMVGLLNTALTPHIMAVENASEVSVFGSLAFTIIHAIIAYGLANACFKAIDIIPNRVVNWVGVIVGSGDGDEAGSNIRGIGTGFGKMEGMRTGAGRGGRRIGIPPGPRS